LVSAIRLQPISSKNKANIDIWKPAL